MTDSASLTVIVHEALLSVPRHYYCIVSLEQARFKTGTSAKTNVPVWHQELQFDVSRLDEELTIQVFHTSKPTPIGEASIPLTSFGHNKSMELNLRLRGKTEKETRKYNGEIHLSLRNSWANVIQPGSPPAADIFAKVSEDQANFKLNLLCSIQTHRTPTTHERVVLAITEEYQYLKEELERWRLVECGKGISTQQKEDNIILITGLLRTLQEKAERICISLDNSNSFGLTSTNYLLSSMNLGNMSFSSSYSYSYYYSSSSSLCIPLILPSNEIKKAPLEFLLHIIKAYSQNIQNLLNINIIEGQSSSTSTSSSSSSSSSSSLNNDGNDSSQSKEVNFNSDDAINTVKDTLLRLFFYLKRGGGEMNISVIVISLSQFLSSINRILSDTSPIATSSSSKNNNQNFIELIERALWCFSCISTTEEGSEEICKEGGHEDIISFLSSVDTKPNPAIVSCLILSNIASFGGLSSYWEQFPLQPIFNLVTHKVSNFQKNSISLMNNMLSSERVAEEICRDSQLKRIIEILNEDGYSSIRPNIAQLISSISFHQKGRQFLLRSGKMESVLGLLNHDSEDLLIHACSILDNLTYNEDAAKEIEKKEVLSRLVFIITNTSYSVRLKRCASHIITRIIPYNLPCQEILREVIGELSSNFFLCLLKTSDDVLCQHGAWIVSLFALYDENKKVFSYKSTLKALIDIFLKSKVEELKEATIWALLNLLRLFNGESLETACTTQSLKVFITYLKKKSTDKLSIPISKLIVLYISKSESNKTTVVSLLEKS